MPGRSVRRFIDRVKDLRLPYAASLFVLREALLLQTGGPLEILRVTLLPLWQSCQGLPLICSRDRTHTGGRSAMWSLTPHGESHVGSHVVTWMVPCVVTLWFTIRVKPRDEAPFSKAHTVSRNLQMLICPNFVSFVLKDCIWSMAFTEL